MSKLQFTCDYCGNIAEKAASKLKYKNAFCSKYCSSKFATKWTDEDAKFVIENLKQMGYDKMAVHFDTTKAAIVRQCGKWAGMGFKMPKFRVKYDIGTIVTSSRGKRMATMIKTAEGWKYISTSVKVRNPRPKGIKYKKSVPKPKVKKLPAEKPKKVPAPRKQLKKPPVQMLSRSQDYSSYTSVKLNSKTTILVRPGADIEKAKLLYAK